MRRALFRVAWAAYKAAHIVHLGPGVWWHDTADVDRFDAADPAKQQQDNALPALPGDRLVAQVEGGGWAPLDWSPDDQRLLVVNYVSVTESYLWSVDVAKGEKTLLTITLTYPSKEARDGAAASGMEHGMAAGYDRLDEILAK